MSFPSLTGDLFVTFNHMELMRFLTDCWKSTSSRNFYLVEAYSLDFIADLGIKKGSLWAETCSAFKGFYWKKNQKQGVLKILLGKKWFPSITSIYWDYFCHWENGISLKLGGYLQVLETWAFTGWYIFAHSSTKKIKNWKYFRQLRDQFKELF